MAFIWMKGKIEVPFWCLQQFLFFRISWYLFLYTTSPYFLLSERFLHRSWSYSLAFCFLFFTKTLISFTRILLNVFFVFLLISSWRIFRHFYIHQKNLWQRFVKKIIKNWSDVLKLFNHNITILFFTNLLKIIWKPLKKHIFFLDFFKVFFYIIIKMEQLRQ